MFNSKILKMKILVFAVFIAYSFSLNVFSQSNITDQVVNDSKNSLKQKESKLDGFKQVQFSKKQKDFTLSTNLYLWALSMGGTTALPVNKPNITMTQTPELNVNLKFSDAIKNLKFAFMLGGKFMYKNFGLLYDVSYCDLKYDGSVPVGSNYLSGTISSKLFNGDFALLYKLPGKSNSVSVFGGVRVTSMNNTMDLVYSDQSVLSVDKSKTLVDPIIGADTKIDLSKKWMVYFKGDVGGMGISSNFTGSFVGTVGYKFNKNWNTNFGVKYIYIYYDKDNLLWKVTQYGTVLSFGYILN